MISMNNEFNKLEKELSGKIPCCLIPAFRKLPNTSEYLNALRYIKSNYEGDFNAKTPLFNFEYNHLELHLLSSGVSHKIINGLRAAYIEKNSYYKALSIIYEHAKKNCLK